MTIGQDPDVAALAEFADDRIRPQDDLFGHVNGRWLETVSIPPDLSRVGGFIDLVLDAEAEVGAILHAARGEVEAGTAVPGTDRHKIGSLFASFLDEERVESLGAAPLADVLAEVDAITDVAELGPLLGRFGREGIFGVVGAYVDTDDRRSDRYLLNVVQGGIGLPDEAYYREDGFAPIRDAYGAHVAATFRLLGWDDDRATTAAERVLALETRLAAGHWDKVRCRDVIATYNLLPLDEVRTAAPAFDWDGWLDAMAAGRDVPLDEVLVRQPSYLDTLSTALEEVAVADWRAWLTFRIASSASPYLSSAFVEEHFDFYRRTLTGTEQNRERWKRGADLCNALLGEAVGAEFVARRFPPEAKAEMQQLVDNLVEAYRVSIGRLPWMTGATRARALEKLEHFRPKIGYPDRWRDYSALEIDAGDLFGNLRRGRAFETDRQIAKLGGPVDRDEWFMTPQTVNAYYNPGTNEICFPAAILQPPFFDPIADPALNYGGIGAVIGHEIGHGFDDQGSQYDGEGNLLDWWTDEDRARFRQLADALIAQYDGFEPRDLPGRRVNGSLTVGENIGDLGGLTIALLAYEISLGEAPAPVIGGMSGRERVLRNWARIWRIATRPALAEQFLTVDPHSPAEFRANIVRNLDEFHETFGTQPGDGLWLDPAHRVRIW
ncbi:M13 family metallopeptidase [Actinomarinicola tropica]|uniref:Peptidase M13 n=1 Tax=Actinomarinicola tropica TaxID=2789776 RepID=A0A5Q2RG76_9ACTN|nr:M13-type metalloendopeptidase [Actinomarinicola tropica]QGG94713.1 peptidase M13 [Actinomarinicola tropica]